jgi:hypothetical protein
LGRSEDVGLHYQPQNVVPKEAVSPEEKRYFWNKTLVEFEGCRTLAELVILHILEEQEGLEGAWAYRANKFTKVWPRDPRPLPPFPVRCYEEIAEANRSAHGCWDLIAWRREEIFFIEAKRRGKDEFNINQKAWFDAARSVGVPLASFV